jgi:hypothetical protein
MTNDNDSMHSTAGMGLDASERREQAKPPRFPTMLRKMWSGGEVQAWIDEHWNAGAPPRLGEMFQGSWRLRLAGIAAECTDPETQAALDKFLEDTP